MSDLRKRKLGQTGLIVNELGLGAMDTPQTKDGEKTLNLAIDSGINFIDTAREYEGSEYLIGQAIRARRAKDFHLSTKTFKRDRDGVQHEVDRSLRVLGVGAIDLYHLHDVSTMEAWDQVMCEGGGLEGLQIAKIRGLIDHIAVSSHNLEILKKAITCGEFEAVMLEYSAFFPETRELIDLAGTRDIGVIVMRPLGGSGRTSSIRTKMRESDGDIFLKPSILLRYVLSNPAVSVVIPGARYPSRVRENVKLASDYEPLTESEQRECEVEANRFF